MFSEKRSSANKDKHSKSNKPSDLENTKKESKQITETKQNARNSSASTKKR